MSSRKGESTIQDFQQMATRLSPLLFAMVTAGLLTVKEGVFANTGEADRFLVRGRPQYMDGLSIVSARKMPGPLAYFCLTASSIALVLSSPNCCTARALFMGLALYSFIASTACPVEVFLPSFAWSWLLLPEQLERTRQQINKIAVRWKTNFFIRAPYHFPMKRINTLDS